MHHDQTVSDMANDVLTRQARDLAERTGKSFEESLKAVLKTKAGHQLEELRDGSHRAQRAERWQENFAPNRAKERRSQARQEELSKTRLIAWESFMQAELRELELRKNGQLARLLGEPLRGEPAAALRQLASEDRRQAEEGLVALMSNGKVFYKHIEQLSEKDMPARVAAKRVRTTWLKERSDGWLGREA